MPSAADVSAAYRSALQRHGETVIIRRYYGTGATRPRQDCTVLAQVGGYQPSELVGPVQQGDRKIIALADDLVKGKFPLPVRKDDKIVVRGKELNIEAADDNSRRVNGLSVAIELRARG